MTVAISAPAVEVAGLRKSFGRTVALDGIDLHVAAGTIFALLGRNGAGRSSRREAQHLHLATGEFAGVLEPGARLPSPRSTLKGVSPAQPQSTSLVRARAYGLAPELIELVPDRAKTITHLSQLLREGCYVLASVILEERGSFPCVLERAGQVRQSLFERNVRHAAAPFTQTAESVKPRRISVPLDQAVTAVTFAVELVFKLQSSRRTGDLVDTFSRPPYGACRS